MRGGALPPALLCAALACALAFAPRRAVAPSLIALVIAAILAHLFRAGGPWTEAIFLGCWISVVVIAATVHLPRGLPTWGAVAAITTTLIQQPRKIASVQGPPARNRWARIAAITSAIRLGARARRGAKARAQARAAQSRAGGSAPPLI